MSEDVAHESKVNVFVLGGGDGEEGVEFDDEAAGVGGVMVVEGGDAGGEDIAFEGGDGFEDEGAVAVEKEELAGAASVAL